ncbi:hypothetical protein WKT02_03505 [Erysipelotrichaceae bacterium HCN-30851]
MIKDIIKYNDLINDKTLLLFNKTKVAVKKENDVNLRCLNGIDTNVDVTINIS